MASWLLYKYIEHFFSEQPRRRINRAESRTEVILNMITIEVKTLVHGWENGMASCNSWNYSYLGVKKGQQQFDQPTSSDVDWVIEGQLQYQLYHDFQYDTSAIEGNDIAMLSFVPINKKLIRWKQATFLLKSINLCIITILTLNWGLESETRHMAPPKLIFKSKKCSFT